MKFGTVFVCAILASSPVLAQPSPTPQGPPGDQSPSWLPGIPDVSGAEIAEPGKLKLSMDRAVELALRQHPTLRLSRAAADAAAGRVDQAKVPYHPTIGLTGTASASSQSRCTNANMVNCGGFFSSGELTGATVNANWRLYDFGQTAASVRSAKANAEAANAGVDTTALDIRVRVETTYLEAIARQRLILVAQATVKSEDAHLDQAKRFVAAQAHDPIEVAQAQSRAANARSTLAQAQSNEAVALANLRAAVGWVDPSRTVTIDPNWPQTSTGEPAPLTDLVTTARGHRPEIVQLDKQIAAADASLTLAFAERRPVLSAFASGAYNPSSTDWSPRPTWTAGFNLSWQLWDGGRSRADVEVARANVQSAIAQRDGLLVTLTSTLEAARALIVSNRANVQASTEAVTAAQAALKLADARYVQGLGSQVELADAQTGVTTAQGNLVSAEWQLADAWAQLQRAIGQF